MSRYNTRQSTPNLQVDYSKLDLILKKNRLTRICERNKKVSEPIDEESWEYYFTTEEVEYLNSLPEEERKTFIEKNDKIYGTSENDKPLRFRILDQDMNNLTKQIIVKRLDENDNDGDSKTTLWVEGLSQLPFKKYVQTDLSNISQYLFNSKKILDECVYGHDEAKLQILEYIAHNATNPNSTGKCLAIQGPPGNGKTSLIKHGFSKALGRPFSQINLGGVDDVSSLSGHGYTYTSSRWGIITNILMTTGVMNPVIYFDELDKVSQTEKGQAVFSFLCHLTDFTQNKTFHDNYFSGIDLDLSRAIFIFSFNDIESINKILLDRLHIIKTKGFSSQDKCKIVRDYIIKDQLEAYHLSKDDVIFPEDVIQTLVGHYSKEEKGVRKIKQVISGIISRVNMLRHLGETENLLKLPYYIENFKLPITITHDIASKLVTFMNVEDNSYMNMYI